MDLKKLRELAEKATPGPWEYRETDGSAAVCHLSGWVEAILPSGTQENADAAYCAAANPATVLALLDMAKNYGLDADHARQERDAMTDKIERLETQWTEVGAAANKALALAEHWKANHDHQVSRARFLIERGDIPLERVRAYDEMQTLRAVLQDIMTEGLIPDGFSLLMARAKAALDGGGAWTT